MTQGAVGGRGYLGNDDPIDWEQSREFLKYLIVFILALSVVLSAAMAVFMPEQRWRIASPALMFLLAAAAGYLLVRGRTGECVRALAFGSWAILSAIAFIGGGMTSTAMVMFPLTIMLTGWLVSLRMAGAIAILAGASTLALALAEAFGRLPPPPATPALLRWGVQACVFIVSMGLIAFLVRAYRNRLAEVRRLGSELALRTLDLEAREAELNHAQAVAHVGSWIFDFAAGTFRLTAETARIFGVPDRNSASAEHWLGYAHAEDRGALSEAWRAAVASRAPFDHEHRIVVGGSERWVRQRAELECDAEGRPLRGVGTTQDISERKRLEQALEQQTERLMLGQRTAKMLIMDWDIRADQLCWSESPEWLRGPLPANGSYPLFIEQVHPEDRERFRATRDESMAKLRPHSQEYRLVRTDGSEIWVRSHANVLPGADGEAARMIVALQDVTAHKQVESERARLEARLRQAQKMEALGTLAGGVAHDFSNIVANILGNVALTRVALGPDHPVRDSLDQIDRAARRARALVQQVLAFGRRQVATRSVQALAPVIETASELLRATLPAGVRLNVACAAAVPPVLADPLQVEQVLINLCNNAAQAIQRQGGRGTIEVALEDCTLEAGAMPGTDTGGQLIGSLAPGRYARLTVSDDGPGMEAATLSRIFEPFFTTQPLGQGTGLGLAAVHGIVQEHGGAIAVRSTPGMGATFTIYLPAGANPMTDAAAVAAPRAQPAPLADAHVLYLDDDDALVLLMTRLLQRHGYRATGFSRATDAVAAVRANPADFDLVVSDYNMPGMSGLEVARAVRDIRGDLPVLLTTGFITEELRAEAPAAGVNELVYKPNTVEELCDIVARLLPARGAAP